MWGEIMIDFAYYTSEYRGQDADEASFPTFLAHARRIIDAMCRWQITDDNLSTYPAIIQNMYCNAVCAQIDWLALNGLESLNSSSDSGFTVGKVTVHGNYYNQKSGKMSNSISPLAMMFLEQSGLLNPSVPVVGCSVC